MRFSVVVTEKALLDLYEIDAYISKHDGAGKAEAVMVQIERTWASLADAPERGAHPPELLELGKLEFREVFFKPYRIVYQVIGREVFVVVIADGRRDMRVLLQQRLLQG